MGFIRESQLHSDLEVYNAISKLKPGQITEVIPVYAKTPDRHARRRLRDLQADLRGSPPAQRELNDLGVQQVIRQGLRENHAQLAP